MPHHNGQNPYYKPHLSIDNQIRQLISRGMIVVDTDVAAQWLSKVSYYRLGLYWYDFEANHETHTFRANTSFCNVVRRYEFDHKLRVLILDALLRIEISIKSSWAHQMSKYHGPHAHLNHDIHNERWESNKTSLLREIERSNEEFINNLQSKYSDETPPIWAVSEVMSFGSLSRWLRSLKDQRVKKSIAGTYRLEISEMNSWTYHLSIIRNTCAHNGRLFNQQLKRITVRLPERLSAYSASRSVYLTLVIITDLLESIDPVSDWKTDMINLISEHDDLQEAMGFPENWRNFPLWQ